MLAAEKGSSSWLTTTLLLSEHGLFTQRGLSGCSLSLIWLVIREGTGVEHKTFTPLVSSCTGGMGPMATVVYKRIATLLSGILILGSLTVEKFTG